MGAVSKGVKVALPGVSPRERCRKNMGKVKQWLARESGFEVFESSALMLGGVAIALFVGTAVLTISAFNYIKIGNTAVGNGVEVNAALQQFH